MHPAALAQGTAPPPGEIVGLLGWIVGLAVLAAAAAFVLRLWLKVDGDADDATAGLGFTLADLRAMKEAGQLDEAEYEAAKQRLIGGASVGSAPPADTRRQPGAPAPPADGGIVWDEDPTEGEDRAGESPGPR